MIETHPFGVFVPPKAKFLILGSFPPRQSTQGNFEEGTSWAWFYGNPRNHFWQILEKVYGRKLENRKEKEKLLVDLHLAMSDVIYQCEREKNNNLDENLVNVVYNTELIEKALRENRIEKIFFSSKFGEKIFKKYFKKIIEKHENIELMTLPSPSPRYAAMSIEEKARKYAELLPRLA